MNTLFTIYLIPGILLVLLAFPLLFEKIKPNPYYGVRVPLTMTDSAVWYAVNKYCARYLIAVGVAVIVAAAGLYFVPKISVDAYALSVLEVFVLAFSVAMLQTWRYISKRK